MSQRGQRRGRVSQGRIVTGGEQRRDRVLGRHRPDTPVGGVLVCGLDLLPRDGEALPDGGRWLRRHGSVEVAGQIGG